MIEWIGAEALMADDNGKRNAAWFCSPPIKPNLDGFQGKEYVGRKGIYADPGGECLLKKQSTCLGCTQPKYLMLVNKSLKRGALLPAMGNGSQRE